MTNVINTRGTGAVYPEARAVRNRQGKLDGVEVQLTINDDTLRSAMGPGFNEPERAIAILPTPSGTWAEFDIPYARTFQNAVNVVRPRRFYVYSRTLTRSEIDTERCSVEGVAYALDTKAGRVYLQNPGENFSVVERLG